MIVVGSQEHGLSRRRHLRLPNGFEYFKGEWLEAGQDPGLSPTMFLVEQGPHSTLAPHFHRENEFQVVVQGGGKFGAHDVHAVMVHYAGAYTGYGPIVAGDQGLSYFTIRSVFEQGAVFLPEGRDQMVRGPKRQMHSKCYLEAGDQELRARTATEVQPLFPPQPDGVAATRILLPPGGAGEAAGTGRGGQFVMVIAGSLVYQQRTLTRWETVFLSPDEGPLPLQAGAGGADVLCLTLAVTATEYSDARPRV
ncbi:MAG TPA: hypothetical protein VIL30_08380 [Ramlibacter sp.]|jgi:hypothetical protein